MKIGVISDSHKDFEALEVAIEIFKKEKVDKIIHLGDDYDDIGHEINNNSGSVAQRREIISVIKVPGVYDMEYLDPKIPNRVILDFEGIKILLTHSSEPHKKDLSADTEPFVMAKKESVNIILCGHTHIPEIAKKNGFVILNPGHLKKDNNRGYPPTYAVISLKDKNIKIKVIELLTGKELLKYE